MIKQLFIFLFIALSSSLSADNFITVFLEKCVEDNKPVSNINIGKSMLAKLADKTDDESLKKAFQDLSSIRIITAENTADSRFYFHKAIEFAEVEFPDFEEVVSVNDRKSKVSVLLKKQDESYQELIMIGLDEGNKLTIISISGKIDFNAISKLSDSLKIDKDINADIENKAD